MKNKHNTMNSSSAQATYMKMQNQLLQDGESVCMLVEAIAKKSQNIPWEAKLNGVQYNHPNIRRVSMDKFYEIVFGEKDAFFKLCKALPDILDDVIAEIHCGNIKNTVYQELESINKDTLKSLYLLAFRSYEGFSKI